MRRRQLLGYTALLITGCQAPFLTHRPELLSQTTLRFAVTDVLSVAEMERDFGQFRQTLSTALGVPIEFVAAATMPAATSALQLNQIDLALAGPSEYVQIRRRTNAQPVLGITRPSYKSVIVKPPQSKLQSLTDLRGKTLALSDISSTSGHLGPMILLLEAGLDPREDLEVQMLGDDGSVAAIRGGRVDAWGGSFLDYQAYLQGYPILTTGPLLPNDLIVASSYLTPEVVVAIRDRLLAWSQDLLQALAATEDTQKYQGSQFVTVQDQDYEPIRQAFARLGEQSFIPEQTW